MGTVIKAGSTGRLMKRFERLALKDHMAEGRAVMQAARERAARIIEEAKIEAIKLTRESHRKGYEEGFSEGRSAGEAAGRNESFAESQKEFRRDQQKLVAQLTSLVATFESGKRDLLERARQDLLAFAVMIAERITKTTARVDHGVAAANAAEAIRQVGSWTDLIIRVHSSDLETMRQYTQDLVREITEHRHVRVVADPSIEPGGCIVESKRTRVDATLTGQFNEVVTLLLGGGEDGSANAGD